MSPDQGLRLALVLGDWSFKSAVILLVACVAARWLVRTATGRRTLWVAAFVAVMAAPVLSLCKGGALSVLTLKTRMEALAPPHFAPTSGNASLATDSLLSPGTLLVVWLIGAVAIAFNGAAGLVAVRRALTQSREWTPALVDLHDLSVRAGCRRPWRLRIGDSDTPPTALTWGWLRPVVLVPKTADGWDEERLTSVLLHELAHINRADSPLQLLVGLVCAAQWFNPMVWLGRVALLAEAESAADEAVLEAGVRPSVYASVLLWAADEMGARPLARRIAATPFARRGELARRVEAVVRPGRRERGATSRLPLISILFAVMLSLLLAPVRVAVAAPDGPSREFIEGFLAGSDQFRLQSGGRPSSESDAIEAYRRWQAGDGSSGPRGSPAAKKLSAELRAIERRLREVR